MTSENPAKLSPSGGVDVQFVLGTGRCGSTLVHEVVAHHPAVAFISNFEDRNTPYWPSRLNGVIYRRLLKNQTEKGRLRFAPSEAYRLLEREVSPLLSNPIRDLTREDVTPWLAERLTRLFTEVTRAQQRSRMLHKFTGWPRIGFLDEVFPESSYVHVVRDGRAVVNSWLQMQWWRGHRGPAGWHWGPMPARYQEEWERSGRSFVVLAGLAWLILMDAYDRASSRLPSERYLQIRYEDLVRCPVEVFRVVCEFLGLEWTKEFESVVSRYGFQTSRLEAFRKDLTCQQVAQLDGLLAPRLAELGYDL